MKLKHNRPSEGACSSAGVHLRTLMQEHSDVSSSMQTRKLVAAAGISLLLTACGGGGGSGNGETQNATADSHTVTATAISGGSIDRDSTTVDDGGSATFTVTPDEGYSILSVTGCDGILSGNTYTTGAISADCSITANFAVNQYMITASAGNGGSFDRGSATVESGGTTTFTLAPDSGYILSSVTGCDGSLSGNTYTTGAITADCSITASFAMIQGTLDQYTVTASAGTGGSFDRSSATVNHGSTTTFTVAPATGYHISSVTGCGGSLSGNTYTTGSITADCSITARFAGNAATNQLTVTASAGSGGAFNRNSAIVNRGDSTSFTVTANTGYSIGSVSGCGGSLSGNTYTTGPVTANCTVSASFVVNQYTVTASAGTGGSFDRSSATVDHGATTSFTLTLDSGYSVDSITGCGGSGSLSGNTYTTGAITANCTITASFSSAGPASAPVPTLSVTTKQLQFSWPAVANTDHYRILVNPDGVSGFSTVPYGGAIPTLSHSVDISVHKLDWLSAQYLVEACNADNSICLSATQTLTPADSVAATGYFKASNSGAGDVFGYAVSISSDGNTLVVGANGERSAATGINGDQTDNTLTYAGAVYVFIRNGSVWSQQAYLKASNTEADDYFGETVSLSADGNTLAVGAIEEDSASTGINGDQTSNTALGSGAVYLFSRSGTVWSQQAYIKAPNAEAGDGFGGAVSLSANGDTLAVGARTEDSAATGVDGDQTDNTSANAGAVYLFSRSGTTWSQQAYVKASNTEANDGFGVAVSLSGNGATLAVGAWGEDSAAQGIDGNQTSNSSSSAGAVYLFSLSGGVWSQQAYVKASNAGTNDYFGTSVSLASDGNTLAVGAWGEKSAATGVDGDQTDNSVLNSGAAYIFSRSGSTWSQQAYVKASNTEADDRFGTSISLSADGDTLAITGHLENSIASGIGGDQTDNSATNAGAVYVFSRSGSSWSQQTYVKASNTGAYDNFGAAVSLSSDGAILAVGAVYEDSAAIGIGGNQTGNSVTSAGAVYLY